MRFLFLGTNFPNRWEATRATFNYDLLRTLSESHDVEVVAPVAWTDEVRNRMRGKGKLGRVHARDGMHVTHPRYYFTPKFFRRHYDRFLAWSIGSERKRLASQNPPDCVLSYWAHPDGAVAGKLARMWNVPHILMVGGSDVLLMTKDPRRREAVRNALLDADAVVAVSEDLGRSVQSLDVPADRVHVMRRGVDARIFHVGDRRTARRKLGIPTDRSSLLWVGRMAPVKGLETLIDAMPELAERHEDIRLYLVGDGPLRNSLSEKVRERGVIDRVIFVGKQRHTELGDWFRAADLTVLPSLSEGIPNVLLESLACGTPFVASRVGGIPEISGHDAARLVKPGDPGELSNAITEMFQRRRFVPSEHRPGTLADFATSVESLARRLVESSASRQIVQATDSATDRNPGVPSYVDTVTP